MTVDFQTSLFEQPAAAGHARLGPLGGSVLRRHLDDGAWVDVRPGWAGGADELFSRLVRDVPWKAERRQMYDRVVAVPRLLRFYGASDPLPDPLLGEARDALSRHYAEELGEPFTTAGMCYYRDGRDSVAWHGDTIGREGREGRAGTLVAILSLGDTRRLSLRPRAGGPSRGFDLGHGDLLVMGGSCQRTWEHAVLKSAGAGPRVSVQFRPHGVH